MSWVVLAEFPIDKNLKDVNDLLLQHRIVHRFTEEGGKQRLWIAEPDRAQEVQNLVMSFLQHQEESSHLEGGAGENQQYQTYETRSKSNNGVSFPFQSLPITTWMVGLSIVGYLIYYFKIQIAWFYLQFTTLEFIAESWQFWRFLTPIIMHFGILHLVFNGVWALVLGMRLEPFLGKANYFILIFVTALAGNLAQALTSGGNFGGLSGVVYGLFGCMFFLHRKWPIRNLALPIGLYIFLLANLVLGFAGVIDLFIAGSIANWAHLGGLLAGAAFGWIFSITHHYKH